MKVICTQENLQSGLQTVVRIISPSNTLPILNNVLLKTNQGQLQISATNLEIGITTMVRCKVEEEGDICLPAKTLNELVNNLPNENVTISSSENSVVVATEHYKTSLKGLPSEEFPLIPAVEKKNNTTLPAQQFKQAIDQVSFAASNSETQPEISGVLVKPEGNKAKLVATDRYRLAEKIIPLPKTLPTKSVIIPQRTVNELSRIIGGREAELELVFGDNQLAAFFQDTSVVTRLIDGQYPPYEQIIPKSFTTAIIIDRIPLMNALKATGIFSYTTHSVSMFYDPANQQVRVAAASHDVGESTVEVSAQIDGPEGSVLLNYRYVLDALNALTSEQVIIKVVNDEVAVVFTPQGQTDYLYLVMPIKA